jgi:hypothetical protein
MPVAVAAAVAIRGEADRVTRVTEKVPLSRHWKVQLSKSKAMILAAAGALSVAAAASMTAATWGPATQAHSAVGTLQPSVTGQLAQASAGVGATTEAFTAATTQRIDAVTLAFRSTPQRIAKGMLRSFGWSPGQFSCLEPLWAHESGWNVTAYNPWSGAYGIPQALPAVKMASAGPDWQTSAVTQIRWGLRYIRGIYGSPCGAWAHEQETGWY